MSVDVDAVNERLNGLVTLLKAVGVDGDNLGVGEKGGALPNVAKQLNDEQIEAIIKKLQQAQTEAPQIIAALEAHAEAKSLADGGGGKGKDDAVEEEVVEEEDEDEEDDEFDEDANYPMVGHGVSDDISVVSDLTTPTVVKDVHVPDEEHYKETLPPMIVGGVGAPSMIIAAPKRKNLVQQVGRPGALAPPGARRGVGAQQPVVGGAAAARRKMYQETMTRLHENPNGMGYIGPSVLPSQAPGPQTPPAPKSGTTPKPVSKTKSNSEKPSKKKTSKKSSSSSQGPAVTGADDGWNTFDEPAAPAKKAGGPTVIDDDGFLVGEAFDPFAAASNPFKSSAGDLEFGSSAGFANFDDNKSASNESKSSKARKSKTKKSSGESGEKKSSVKKTSSSGAPKRSRRMSAVH